MHRRLLLLVLTSVLSACATGAGASTPTTASTPSHGGSGPVTAVFLGDSYTAASETGDGYVRPTAEAMGWDAVLRGEGGTGYVASAADPPGTPYGTRIDQVVADQPDVVVVQGSTNDAAEPLSDIGAAAGQVYAELTERLPRARIVVLGPLSPPGVDATAMVGVRDTLAAAAHAADLPFIDPIGGKWLTPADGLYADPVHPDQTGYDQLAADLVEALHAQGL